jgi:polar amino acid transport system substrate-binding protein/glutamate/aspartate transport system substrate-binding protein
MLDANQISAYFADRAILQSLVKESKDPKKLMLADNYLTVEPYALGLPHGDEDFRLAVDRALSHLYRDGEITKIFAQSFQGQMEPSGILKTLYLITGLPEVAPGLPVAAFMAVPGVTPTGRLTPVDARSGDSQLPLGC